MTDNQERILRGCKFLLGPGCANWDSALTKKALQRLWDLISEELSEPKEPEATPEFAEELLKHEV